MQTASVVLVNPKDEIKHTSRLLLDCGSQRTYISKFMAEKLKLKEIGKNFLIVHTFGKNKPENIETNVVELGIKLKSGFTMNVKANIVPNITGKIQRRPVQKILQEELGKFQLADSIPNSVETTYIDLLIGNDYYADIISLQRIVLAEGLYLLQSKLGWVLSGRINENFSSSHDYSVSMLSCYSSGWLNDMSISSVDETVDVRPRLEEFWQLETIGIKESPDESDDKKSFIKV